MSLSLHHTHLLATDIDATVEFWSRAFGAEVVYDEDFAGARNVFLTVGTGRLHLYDQTPKVVGQGTVHHLGIQVDDLEGIGTAPRPRRLGHRHPGTNPPPTTRWPRGASRKRGRRSRSWRRRVRGCRGRVMASRPTMVTGRRRQHELVRLWSGWPLTSILIDPGEVARVREAGWSGTHHEVPESGGRFVGTPDGLGFGVDGAWGSSVEVVLWAEVEAIARAVPEQVRQRLLDFRARWRDHQVAYPRFAASGEPAGCGPSCPAGRGDAATLLGNWPTMVAAAKDLWVSLPGRRPGVDEPDRPLTSLSASRVHHGFPWTQAVVNPRPTA
jgi:hypothetical protein